MFFLINSKVHNEKRGLWKFDTHNTYTMEEGQKIAEHSLPCLFMLADLVRSASKKKKEKKENNNNNRSY